MPGIVRRAYSLWEIKSIDEDQRIIEGIATTPETDRMGDIVEPEGAEFVLPIPLLWQHNSSKPIGSVFEAKITPKGILIKAKIEKMDEPGTLKDRLDEAWHSLKLKLVRGLSIGFQPLEAAYIKDSWSQHFLKWAWLELSCVTIAANAGASITNVKSADRQQLAASGIKLNRSVSLSDTPPGVAGTQSTAIPKPKENIMAGKTIAEQIAAFEAKRQATAARMTSLMEKASEETRTLTTDEETEYEDLKAELKAVDTHIARLKAHEKDVLASATVVSSGDDNAAGGSIQRGVTGVERDPPRGGESRITGVRVNLEKGIAFTRYVKALAMAKGNLPGALAIAAGNKVWEQQTPQVIAALKAAVVAGDTTSAGWASELVYNENLVAEFMELLRPATVIGKLTGVTRVPFNVRMGGQTGGSSAYWVGQGKPIPVSKLTTTDLTLGIAKAAGLVVLTQELVRSSSPSAELLVRNDLVAAIAQFLDQQFLDPGYAAVTNVSPASITSGVTPTAATGTASTDLRTDVATLFGTWIAANLNPASGVWIMPETMALSISLMLNSLGQPVFPTITMTGGTFMGLPVITSQSAVVAGSPVAGEGNMIILVNQREVMLADDGQTVIDASAEASLEMLDNPTNNVTTPTATSMVSMFQTDSVALRATRFINWKKRRSTAVAYIKDAAYR